MAGAYDRIGANQFNLLTVAGLREHHRLLDIGCGSLRAGRLLIPYLLPGNYFGVEPQRWLVEEAIDREVGAELVERRRPTFSHDPDVRFADLAESFDFLLAHSVLSHAPLSMVDGWLANARGVMTTSSVFFATVHLGRREHTGDQWTYPGLLPHTRGSLEAAAERHGLTLQRIDWPPPKRQTWVAFVRADGDVSVGDIEPGRVLRTARWRRRLRDLRSHLASLRGGTPAHRGRGRQSLKMDR